MVALGLREGDGVVEIEKSEDLDDLVERDTLGETEGEREEGGEKVLVGDLLEKMDGVKEEEDVGAELRVTDGVGLEVEGCESVGDWEEVVDID